MFKKNNGSTENEILQNEFTSFLSTALNNQKIDFIRTRNARLKREQSTDQYEQMAAQETYEIDIFMEKEALLQAIKEIRGRERYVLLARVLDKKKFKEIGKDLGIGEKGASAIYYRAAEKLRKILKGGE